MDFKFLKNIMNIIVSNLITFLIGIMASFITPYILGNVGYGYYKLFTLYIGYIPLLHFGLIDGVLTEFAGRDYVDISKQKLRNITLFAILLELIISVSIIIVDFAFIRDEIIKYLILSISTYSFLFNLLTYFQYFSKAVMRFSEFASMTRIQSLLNLLFLLVGLLIYKIYNSIHVTYYFFYINLIILIVLVVYFVKYKDIVFGKKDPFKISIMEFIKIIKSGFFIMIAYQMLLIITNADNQFISMFFNVVDFSVYAFSYTLATMLVLVFNALSSVMLPYMKKLGKEKVINNYSYNLGLISIIVFFLMISYYPITFIVNSFLSKYSLSLNYLSIVFPTVAIICIVQSYMINNFVLIGKIKLFSLITLINIILDYSVYYVIYLFSKNIFYNAYAAVFLIIIWYLSLELYLHIKIKTSFFKNLIYIITVSITFILINNISNNLLRFLLFCGLLTLITYLFHARDIIKLIKKFNTASKIGNEERF